MTSNNPVHEVGYSLPNGWGFVQTISCLFLKQDRHIWLSALIFSRTFQRNHNLLKMYFLKCRLKNLIKEFLAIELVELIYYEISVRTIGILNNFSLYGRSIVFAYWPRDFLSTNLNKNQDYDVTGINLEGLHVSKTIKNRF